MSGRSWPAFLSLAAVVCLGFAAPAPLTVKVVIPDYTVSRVGGLDEATIRDGQVLASEWRPQVPYYVKTIEYPAGYRIQTVVLKERVNARSDSGLNLPVFHTEEAPPGIHEVLAGVFPQKDYDWSVRYEPGGPTLLTISVYPFHYDPKTTKVTFYRDYEFEIRYAETSVAISALEVNNPIYDPGENVRIGLHLENSGKPQPVTVDASIFKAFSNEKVADVPSIDIRTVGKADSVTLEWPTAGFPAGDYQVEAVARDPRGNELDRERTLFRLGNPQGEVTGFKAEPQQFKIGDKIQLRLDFKNTGSCDLSGECIIRIMKASEVVDELRQKMRDLKPGSAVTFRDSWSTGKAEKAAVYRAVGFVTYEGTACQPRSAMFSTNAMPVADLAVTPESAKVRQEIRFDASGSGDKDGRIVRYDWEFDDGGEATDSATTHVYYQPGEYNVTLTVTDNEGGTDTATKKVVVGE